MMFPYEVVYVDNNTNSIRKEGGVVSGEGRSEAIAHLEEYYDAYEDGRELVSVGLMTYDEEENTIQDWFVAFDSEIIHEEKEPLLN